MKNLDDEGLLTLLGEAEGLMDSGISSRDHTKIKTIQDTKVSGRFQDTKPIEVDDLVLVVDEKKKTSGLEVLLLKPVKDGMGQPVKHW
uniref:Uncharacterized protein n=1 Tax=Anopheles christyi TaxID=43041 RepID=A0A182K5N5_9DIPT